MRAAFLAAIALCAASQRADDDPARAVPAQVSLAALTGAEVVLESTSSAASASRGKVADVVFSTNDAQIACAALSIGKLVRSDDRIVLVPATVLRYALLGRQPGFVLRMTTAELRALPEFDVLKDGKEGLDRAVEHALGVKVDANGRDKPDGIAPTLAPKYTLSSRLGGVEVDANDGMFGKVHDASVDARSNSIGYLLVSRGDSASVGVTLWIVPLRACRWTGPPDQNVLRLGKSIAQLKSAPEYKPPDRELITPEQMKAADAFFGEKPAGAGSR
jgi:sporulation protein YlmC with PRC-barrel domain